MLKEFQKFDLSYDSLCVNQVLEGFRHLFYRYLVLGNVVVR